VAIPCNAAHFYVGRRGNARAAPADLETGYIYVGGWGAGSSGIAVDAGLQKSSQQAAREDYAPYWKYGTDNPVSFPHAHRFPCGGPDVTLEFYPLTAEVLYFSASGMSTEHRRVTYTFVQLTRRSDGWLPDGGGSGTGIILKRIVSIAQPREWHKSSPQNDVFYRDGSFFGVTATDNNPRLRWTSCEIGKVSVDGAPLFRRWTDRETWSGLSTVQDWPATAILKGRDPGVCDAVGIDLRRGLLSQ